MRPARRLLKKVSSLYTLIGAAVLLTVVVVVAAAVILAGRGSTGDVVAAGPAPPAPPAATSKPGADDAPKPTPTGLAAALKLPLADPNLGAFTGRVTDALTGTQLWEQGATLPMMPASTNKLSPFNTNSTAVGAAVSLAM